MNARQNLKKLTPADYELLVRLLRNPFTMTRDLMNTKQIKRLVYTLTPDAPDMSRLALFHALGYIKPASVDGFPLDFYFEYAVVDYLRQNPLADNAEISNGTGYSYSTVKVYFSQLTRRFVGGSHSSKSDLRRLAFFDKIGWLDRDMMDADIERLKPNGGVLPMFRWNVADASRDVLYHLYMNPFASRDDVCKLAECSMFTYNYALLTHFETRSRIEAFGMLGYISIPKPQRNTPPDQADIILDWKAHPASTLKDTAERLGLVHGTVARTVSEIYAVNGYNRVPLSRSNFKRLGFYWYMGWFDAPQMQQDARRQYSQLGATI